MLKQTRNALIYSDLAIFMLDARNGVDRQDFELEEWLKSKKMAI
jgi:predicted GTPase